MWKRFVFRVLVLVCFGEIVFSASEGIEAKELVVNATFESADREQLPRGWSVWSPVWDKAACRLKSVDEGLLVEAADPYAVGGVFQEIKDIEPRQAYAVKAVCRLRNIPTPYQSVLLRIIWTRRGKLLHPAGMLVRGRVLAGGIASFEDVLVAPETADGARLSLEVKWPQGGSVIWREVSVQPTLAPGHGRLKWVLYICDRETVHLRII